MDKIFQIGKRYLLNSRVIPVALDEGCNNDLRGTIHAMLTIFDAKKV